MEDGDSWSETDSETFELSSSSSSYYDSDPIEYIEDPDLPSSAELRTAWIALKRQYRPEHMTGEVVSDACTAINSSGNRQEKQARLVAARGAAAASADLAMAPPGIDTVN